MPILWILAVAICFVALAWGALSLRLRRDRRMAVLVGVVALVVASLLLDGVAVWRAPAYSAESRRADPRGVWVASGGVSRFSPGGLFGAWGNLLISSGLLALVGLTDRSIVELRSLRRARAQAQGSQERQVLDRQRALGARARQQEAVANLGRRILAVDSLESALDDAVHTVARTLELNHCGLFVYSPAQCSLVLRAAAGTDASLVGHVTLAATRDQHLGRALLESGRVLIEDFDHSNPIGRPMLVGYSQVRSGAAVVIPGSPEPFGVLAVYAVERSRFAEEDAHFLQGVANLMAAAVDRDRVLRELDRGLDRALQSQKLEALGTLSGGIAHDFNNTLHAIIGNTQLALAATAMGSAARGNLEAVLGAAQRASELTRQILTFGLRNRTVREPTEVGEVIEQVVALMRASLPPSIEIRTWIQAGHALVEADATQLYQILVNLCTNAGRAMRDSGGQLEIGVELVPAERSQSLRELRLADRDYVHLWVRDTGYGIPVENRERIFEPFFSASEGGSEASEGTGMGLAVVQSIIDSQAGAISVTSTRGEGATFDVYLPRSYAAGSTQHAHPTRPALAPSGAGETILFVDDEPALVSMTEQALGSLGYQVVGMTRSDEALALFRRDPGRFALVVMDQHMPVMNGDVLAKEILAIRPDLPILLCTGLSDALTEEEARATGITDYLAKPLTIEELGAAVRRALRASGPGTYPAARVSARS